MDNDLISALELLINTGRPSVNEFGDAEWVISETQRRTALRALKAAKANSRPLPGRGVATLVWAQRYADRPTVDATCSECGHVNRITFAGWSAIVCPSCKSELQRGSVQ